MYERLTNVVNELERVVFSLDKGKPRGKNEALVAEFFRIFRDVERIIPEYEEVRNQHPQPHPENRPSHA